MKNASTSDLLLLSSTSVGLLATRKRRVLVTLVEPPTVLATKAVNREDKRSRRYRDRHFAKFERSRRYRDR